MKGKILSQLGKILACFIVILSLVINCCAGRTVIPIDDSMKVGFFVFIMFLPIDVSIWMDIVISKFTKKTIPEDSKE